MSLMPPNDGRDSNQTAVLAALRRHGPLSRADLSRLIGLSPPTIGDTVRRLQRRRMIQELALAPSNGGRPGQLLGIIPAAAHAVGVKVSADHLTIVQAQLDGSIVDSMTREFDSATRQPAAALATILDPVVEALDAPLLGIGVGVPGIIDSPDAGVVTAPTLGWSELPLGRQLRGALGLPVVIENDVKALAVAEQLYGIGRNVDNFILLTIGRGIGCAIVSNQLLNRGAHGSAGEIAHLPLEGSTTRCACGRTGCLEASIGTAGLLRTARKRRLISTAATMHDLHQLARSGDQRARRLFTEAGGTLARTVAAILTALAPQTLIIAGEGAQHWDLWSTGFTETLATLVPTNQALPVPTAVLDWQDRTWAQGAAALILATPFAAAPPSGEQTPRVIARLGA